MGDRHRFRADWHDYSSGIYFVTICSYQKRHFFGEIAANIFTPTLLGTVIKEHIEAIPLHHPYTELWNYVIMPNHIHMVIAVAVNASAPIEPTSGNIGCLRSPRHGEAPDDFHHNSRLSVIIGAFKAGVTRTVRTRKIASLPCWQSRFHEHIIRTQQSFDNIMRYIDTNIENWSTDCFAD